MNFISKVDALPTLPDIYKDISTQIKKNASIAEIAKCVEKDLSLSSYVLKLANSALYGRKSGSVSQSIMKIGLSNLREIVLSYSVFNFLDKDKKALEDIWTKAIVCNNMLTLFYTSCLKEEIPANYASVGLLHDIGKLFLYTYKDKFKLNDVDCPSHENLGGYLLSHWDLPLPYVEGAMFHHRPLDRRVIHKKLVAVLYIVHYYLEKTNDEEMLETVYKTLGVEREQAEEALEKYIDQRG